MNNITIAGQLGKDAEQRFLPDGTAVCNFSVADNQGKNKDPIWWRCQIFGKRAESLAQYLTKGQSVTVSGTVTERVYKKDGEELIATEVRVNDVALQGGRQPSQQSARPGQQSQTKPSKPSSSGFDDMDDDIPF